MTLIRPDAETGDATDMLSDAREHYVRAVRAFKALTQRVESGDLVASTDSDRAARDLQKATQTLFDERQRLDRQIRKQAGVVHEYALDFDAARDEIRGRLARLRGAGRSGSIPE